MTIEYFNYYSYLLILLQHILYELGFVEFRAVDGLHYTTLLIKELIKNIAVGLILML